MKRKMEKYSLICITHPSLLLTKAVVGIVKNDLDKKGHDASCLVSVFQETVVAGCQFQIDVLTS